MNRTLWGMTIIMLTACESSGSSARPTLRDAGVSQESVRDDSAEIPCEPRAVLENVCQKCHARPARNGAPFPLERRSDVFRTYGGVVIRELMIEEVGARRMPLSPVTIDDAQRETLLAWLNAGAPAIPASTCSDAGDASSASTPLADADAGVDADIADAAAQTDADWDGGIDDGALLFDGGDDQ